MNRNRSVRRLNPGDKGIFSSIRLYLVVACISHLAFAFGGLCQHAFAQPKIDRFSTPAVQRGVPAEITIAGSIPNWPLKFDVDRDDVKIIALEKKSVIRIESAADIPPGPVWIRAYDDNGASDLHALLIESSKVVSETEPNNDLANLNSVDLPCAVGGVLEKSGDVDWFKVNLRAGKTFVASLAAHRMLGSPMDAVLQLTDERGNVLQQSDDVHGVDPEIVFTAQRDQTCIVRVFAFPETPTGTIGFAGGANFAYRLLLNDWPMIDHVLPLSVRDGQKFDAPFGWNLNGTEPIRQKVFENRGQAIVWSSDAQGYQVVPIGREGAKTFRDGDGPVKIEFPCDISGRISVRDQRDRFQFTAVKDKQYVFQVESQSLGMSLDAGLEILDAEGKKLAESDDRDKTDHDCTLVFKARQDGDFTLSIFDVPGFAGGRYAYLIRAGEAAPDFKLNLDSQKFSLDAGGQLEINVKVDRQYNFAEQIEIRVEGLPQGVTCEPVKSEPKDATAKAVKLKLVAKEAAPFNGTIKIQGKFGDREGNAVFEIPHGYLLQDVWLTVKPKK